MQMLQLARHARRKVVVEQDGAGIKTLQAEPATGTQQGFKHQLAAIGQGHCRGCGDLHVQRAQAHIEPGLGEDAHQPLHAAEVEGVVAAMRLLGDQQQVLGLGADLLDRRHRRLHRQRQHLHGQVVEAGREQVGVHWGELEAGIAQINRAVKRRRVLHPFEPKPALDGRHRVEDARFKLIDRAGERGKEVGNHVRLPVCKEGRLILADEAGLAIGHAELRDGLHQLKKGCQRQPFGLGRASRPVCFSLICCTPSRRAS